ncbi:hypothetical protein ACLOJK_037858 [Asimina triloba]
MVPFVDNVELHRLWEEVTAVKVEVGLAQEARSKAKAKLRKIYDRLRVLEKVLGNLEKVEVLEATTIDSSLAMTWADMLKENLRSLGYHQR